VIKTKNLCVTCTFFKQERVPGYCVSAVRCVCPKLARIQLFSVVISLVSLISLNDIYNHICLNLVFLQDKLSIRLGSDNWGIFFFSRPALGTIQSPVQWVRRIKSSGRRADHTSPSSAEVKNEGSCTSNLPYFLCCAGEQVFLCRYTFTLRSSWLWRVFYVVGTNFAEKVLPSPHWL